MANEVISFFCPACGTKLTVPASMAGVSGPCPTCNSPIQAPHATSVPADYSAPPAAAPRQEEPPPIPASPAVLKPEPRQLPSRQHPSEVVAKQMPEPSGNSDHRKPNPLPRHPNQSSLLSRFLMLVLFLIASGALIFGILTVLNMPKDQAPPANENILNPAPPKTEPAPVKPISELPVLPTPAPKLPTLIEPAPDLPEGMHPKLPGIEALEVLEKFLNAKSLAERLPMIETKTPKDELAASCLARPLPPSPKMLLAFQESNLMEEVVDFYYNVDFKISNKASSPQTILVRTRGGGDPKVVVDPLLDLLGSRLANYASKPSDKGGVFQVIVSPLASCTNPDVPNREKKLTLKLLARDDTKQIAEAYFSKVSKIGEMLEDGTYSLSYGKAKACTLMLRWNTEEDTKNPYLEAIAIKALDWNP